MLLFFFTATSFAVAQQRSRDILFPHFQEDIAALNKKESKETSAPKQKGRSTKEALFTNYRPQPVASPGPQAMRSRTAGKSQPSDISSEAALQEIRTKQATNLQPAIVHPSTQSDGPVEMKQPRQMQIKKN